MKTFSKMKTHYNEDLTIQDIDKEVTLAGWVSAVRDLGGIIFVELRDKSGFFQVVADPQINPDVHAVFSKLKDEYVIQVSGKISKRPQETYNPDLATGEIEMYPQSVKIFSEAKLLPFELASDDTKEDIRLKYRYLDIRRPQMYGNLKLRHNIVTAIRNYLNNAQFMEVETPILINTTPEGARDYLVPSRVQEGKFYALPQSPQIFKQLLMVGGIEKYYQIAKCFRDEDLRADRQPEFTQIDLEMSFVDMDDVIEIQEGVLKKVFKELLDVEIETPLPRLTYDEAMERYGSDKPDTRFGFELKKLNDVVKDCGFKVFTDALASGGDVRGICINGGSEKFSRKDIDKLTEACRSYGAKGLVWLRVMGEGEYNSSVNKFFTNEELRNIADVFDAEAGDLILIVSDRPKVVFDTLGFLRRDIAGKMGLLDDKRYNLLWVVDFPLFEKDDESGELKAMHHPFTSPKLDQIELLDSCPEKVKADAYDIVLNGVELGGGSIRIHDRNLQAKMFEVLGLTKEECEEKFGFLIEAFKYGAPPHGGLAYGLDRLVMLLLGESSIREVMAFPKNQNAQCMVSEAPAPVDDVQLEELGIVTRNAQL